MRVAHDMHLKRLGGRTQQQPGQPDCLPDLLNRPRNLVIIASMSSPEPTRLRTSFQSTHFQAQLAQRLAVKAQESIHKAPVEV